MSEESSEHAGPLTGWEASAPVSDTVLRQFLLAQTAFQRLSGESLGATVVETDRYVAVDLGRPATLLNFAILRQPLFGVELEEAMDELHALYGAPGKSGWAALYSPLPTADLSPWGWTLAGHPPLQLRSRSFPLVDTSAVRVDRVTTDEAMAVFEQIIIQGFEMSEMLGRPAGSLLPASLLADPRFTAWMGYVEGEPVAAAASLVEAEIVDVVMVATLPAARRRGAGLAVTQAAARPELGLPGVLFSSDEGRPVYEKLGFVPIMRGAFWYWNR